MDKTYRTRDGQEVQLFTITRNHFYNPIVGEVDGGLLTWTSDGQYCHGYFPEVDGGLMTWTSDGLFSKSNCLDLVEIQPRIEKTYWINVYPRSISRSHETKEDADMHCLDYRIACLPFVIDCEVGTGIK
jgi:hypothetical protein